MVWDFDKNEKLSFSKAIVYDLSSVPVDHPWRDATGGFGGAIPLQCWVELYDTDGNHAGTFTSHGMIDNIFPLILTGETKSYRDWYNFIYWKLRNFGFNSPQITDLGQFDLLMLCIMATRRDLPLYKFLGAKKNWASAYKGGGSLLADDDLLVSDMTRFVREGFTTIKFKVGSDWGHNMSRDIRRLKKVREAVGPDIKIAIDANQVWSKDDAIKFAKMAEPYDIDWFEEPINSQHMDEIQEVVDNCSMQICYGESMRNYYAQIGYAEHGVQILDPYIGRTPSMWENYKTSLYCKEHGLRFVSGGMTWINASLGALYDEDQLLEFHEPMVGPMGKLLNTKCKIKNGRFYLPDIPGQAFRVDWEVIKKRNLLKSITWYSKDNVSKDFHVKGSY